MVSAWAKTSTIRTLSEASFAESAGDTAEVSMPVRNSAPSFCTARVAPSTAVSGVPA
jgi:hypothetical protein